MVGHSACAGDAASRDCGAARAAKAGMNASGAGSLYPQRSARPLGVVRSPYGELAPGEGTALIASSALTSFQTANKSSKDFWGLRVDVDPREANASPLSRSRRARTRCKSNSASAMRRAHSSAGPSTPSPAILWASASISGANALSAVTGILNPCRKEFRAERALPAAVLGPVLACALVRLARTRR